MSKIVEDLIHFINYASVLEGDEKGEAQVFCDRLFKAFGHDGYKEAGATLEFRIKKASSKGTSFADLMWKPRLLLEMKKRGEKLHLHYGQAFDYWLNAVPHRPRYVVLCNFDEFWIYDFDKQLDEPVDVVELAELPKRYTALNFLFPDDRKPLFNNDREAVSREAANSMAMLFKRLTHRLSNPVPRVQAQRFVLQTVIAMFAEDIDLLPAGTVKSIVDDCFEHKQSSYDLFGALFNQMNNPKPALAGRFKGVRYFNGGLFSKVEPIELTNAELELIGGDDGAALMDWSKVSPVIFGSLFQQSMDANERHALGAHFTSEADIQRIVGPTIVRPWRERIDQAKSAKELFELRRELMDFKVLDPACGSGNFLYVSFRELARLDLRILTRAEEMLTPKEFANRAKPICAISPTQFYGLDIDTFGVELAKVSLMMAKKLALDEAITVLSHDQTQFSFVDEDALPLDNLDGNVQRDDAVFCEWPKVDTIIGNPPFQSKNKMIDEFGRAYVNRVRTAHPEVPGRADYCVYWLRKAHDQLQPGQRAGLVGTNTIRQNYSRIGGLDHIVRNNGTITEAVSSQVWSGDAVVHVSIVNWVKGEQPGPKKLFKQNGDQLESPWEVRDVDTINSALSFGIDLKDAKALTVNAKSDACYQGQTHGHDGFLMSHSEATLMIAAEPSFGEVLFPFLITDDLIGTTAGKPSRYVIDFGKRELLEAQSYKELFKRVEKRVLPDREKSAAKEKAENEEALKDNPKAKIAKDHSSALERWWLLFRAREKMLAATAKLPRYIACGRVTKRPIFEFIDPAIHPNDSLTVFPLADDYSFGVLQSGIHWQWFNERCSSMKADPRYTSNTVFDSFPWPQDPKPKTVKAVAEAAVALRTLRHKLVEKHNMGLRELYRTTEKPGAHPLKDAQAKLDHAVREAFGMPKGKDAVQFLFDLNQELAVKQENGQEVRGPGLPSFINDPAAYITSDRLTA
ncbi:DNA methyltransferase [Bradyrhizobium diazoefficiens]|uniref:site-specific DNA-methyltransferase (adenine-specific) n=3 Tax=Bradyrhizobium diazoefficiens TaxID=1355477 RepID=A0A810BPJ6_9BRAD|nr:DNA methyltransferase [Bradyrhizobium diazoefficiens]WLC15663.1 N-6 DNA methylase [Bradyrhizobium diazoefficiens]BCE78207.1 DNA modification methyltransferase [Bradyrhizobium diazoefficiens]